MIISLLNQKGGAGKSTLAINLARAFTIKGKHTILIDSDIQGSALKWFKKSEDHNLIDFLDLTEKTIYKDIPEQVGDREIVIVDGLSKASEMASNTILCSDIVLIPVNASGFDVDASEPILDYLAHIQKIRKGMPKAAFILCRQNSRTNMAEVIRESLKKYNLPIFNAGTFDRLAYLSCLDTGLTVFELGYKAKAAQKEILNIMEELNQFCKENHLNVLC